MTVAGEGQVPVGKLLGRAPRRSKWAHAWRALVRWRDWSLPVKLSAVTVVPIVIALVLGITTIAGQVARADDYQRLDRLVALAGQLRTLTGALQAERTLTAATLTAGTVGGTPELAAARKAVDGAVAPFAAARGRAVDAEPRLSAASQAASVEVTRLAELRRAADAGQLDPVPAVTEYTKVVTALLDLGTAVTASAGDGTLEGTPSALHDLQVAGEQVSISQALIAYGIARAGLAPSELATVRTAELRLADRLGDFRAAANGAQRLDYDTTVAGQDAVNRDGMVQAVLAGQGTLGDQTLRRMSEQDWNAASASILTKTGDVTGRLNTSAAAASAAQVESSSSGAGLLAVLLFAAMVLAVAVVFLITRQLLRSLKVLRASALDVAEQQLPDAVRNIQEGRAQSIDVQPVAVDTDDEVGEVARAFDKVHHQALRLATEQAAMRTGYGSVFVNLSRRSQSLVQRQLQLIEQLERDEEDADQLATLFQLDHLATRMRRNNENLMVLSGAEPGRRSGKPVGTTDMLRAAVSEIEQYQRVSVQPPPPARIVGYAASDLMRLVAELLDNATAFSAPETSVTVATRLAEDGALNIDILDKGIGMNEAEVCEANTRLTEAGSVDLATSRRMGLFVVGRLASRHRIGVSLHGGKDIVGVRATVVVPPELVMPATDGPVTGPIGARLAGHQPPPSGPNRLPRRPVNGTHPRPMVPQQPAMGEERWPSASDLAGLTNGNGAGPAVRPPSDLEISGTALFAPIPRDAPGPPPRPSLPPVPAVLPVPPKEPLRADDLPSGKDLFSANGTALSDWWQQATAAKPPAPPPDRSETTPIFDEMLSAWFRAVPAEDAKPAEEPKEAKDGEEAKPAEAVTAAQQERSWDFASDANWRTVQAVTQTAPSTFTEAGLPRRRRGEQLLPGSATPEPVVSDAEPPKTDLPVRDPADVRGRLSSFQAGVTRGREAAKQALAPTAPKAPEALKAPDAPEQKETPAPQPPAPEAKAAPAPPPALAGRPPKAPPVLPSRRPATPPPAPASSAPAPRREETALEATAEWAFGADESWKAVQAVSQAAPSTFTQAGLPRRRRGEQLLPGSAAPPAGATAPRPTRDAHDVRGRLRSFQQGIERGRHRPAKPAETNHETLEGE